MKQNRGTRPWRWQADDRLSLEPGVQRRGVGSSSEKKKLSRVVTMGVHIGLGDTSGAGPAAVRWPSGSEQAVKRVRPGEVHVVVEVR